MQRENSQSGDKILWGAAEIGKEINRSARQTFHLLNTGAIRAARKVNGLWCAPRATLRAQFYGPSAEAHPQ
jgi:hypothetical protein